MTVASRTMLHASRFMVHGSWFKAARLEEVHGSWFMHRASLLVAAGRAAWTKLDQFLVQLWHNAMQSLYIQLVQLRVLAYAWT